MVKKATIITEISPDELSNMIEEKLNDAIVKLKMHLEKNVVAEIDETVIFKSKKDAAAYLKISTVSLSKYIKNGWVKGYKLGGRVRFKRSELDHAMKVLRNIAQ